MAMVEISFRATSQELRKWAKPMLCRPGMMKTGLYYYRKKKLGSTENCFGHELRKWANPWYAGQV